MIALGSNVHIFARPHRREDLTRCFETVVGGSTVRTVEFPGIGQPMLVISCPGGGHLSIEFTEDAPDDEQPRLAAWLELQAGDPPAVLQGRAGRRSYTGQAPRPPVLFHDPRRPGVHDRAGELNVDDRMLLGHSALLPLGLRRRASQDRGQRPGVMGGGNLPARLVAEGAWRR